MKSRLTRRAVTKILIAVPAALAAGPLGCQSTGPGGSAPQRLTPAEQKEREDLGKTTSRLKQSIERLGQMKIPIGSEPAVHFTPLVAKK
jgi:hypothetical protein